jgi:hypothetical protein
MTTFQVKGQVLGDYLLRRNLAMASERYRWNLRDWLKSERRSFVGDKERDGVFRKKLERKTNLKGNGWSKSITRQFKGFISSDQKIDGMKLTMGILGRHSIHRGLALLEDGGTINTSKKMIVPIYSNITNKKGAHRKFLDMSLRNQLVMKMSKTGKQLYFRKNSIGSFGTRDLLFIGVNKINVSKQYSFFGDWNNRIPKVIERGQRKVDTTTKQIERNLNSNREFING